MSWLTLEEIGSMSGGVVGGVMDGGDGAVNGVSIDSRSLRAGEAEVIHDRERTIRRALSTTPAAGRDDCRDDCVVVAGKGHETFQLVRGKRIAFDDAELVRRVLEAAA